MTQASAEGRSVWRRIGEVALRILAFFVILEPIWMLLPFAGFLYGSGLRIEELGRHPTTAWLTHFVFPVGTLGWCGPSMVVVGFLLFLAAAFQIYSAKIRKSGLVTTGLYRFVRHPQYIALTLFGLGLLLAWGRAIMFLAFFLMMFLYYYLAKNEEVACLRLFGEQYERYRERTSFIVPGDRSLRPLGVWLSKRDLPAPLRVAGAFVLTMSFCLGLMWLINALKAAVGTVPYMTTTVSLGPVDEAAAQRAKDITAGKTGPVAFVQAGRAAVVRGPCPNAAASGFAERVLQRLKASKALQKFLGFLAEPNGDAALVFCLPFEKPDQPRTPGTRGGEGERRGPPPDPAGPDRVRLMLMRCTLAEGASIEDALRDKSKRQVRGACIAPANLARPDTEDMVEGEVFTPGPGFPAEQRWDFIMGQLAARPASGTGQGTAAVVPGQADTTRLVLVQAPVMRTRRDPAFAKEILDRLVASPKFVQRLRASGAGNEVVPVVFPRPGPNWYSEHHGTPQISAFVVLARLRTADSSLDELFQHGGRELLSAFIADIDFKIDASQDSVTEIATVGPARDLDERWQFFLSGVGGPTSVSRR
ncbi:MAG: isoprenylcysteine carboxylmethyltransferase family protein [Planctomycetota bacterium]|nr:isoprenylcysteine carboxylmethyltransferase family protein [Planctomycetota bacterium]